MITKTLEADGEWQLFVKMSIVYKIPFDTLHKAQDFLRKQWEKSKKTININKIFDETNHSIWGVVNLFLN